MTTEILNLCFYIVGDGVLDVPQKPPQNFTLIMHISCYPYEETGGIIPPLRTNENAIISWDIYNIAKGKYIMEEKILTVNYENANSRETYYTMHNVKEAHKYGKGKDIKVGIIDWCFGLNKYSHLYASGVDVSDSFAHLNDYSRHGYWMACVLREISPECQIYAINYLNGNNFDIRAEYIVKAIDWAIENSIDILTCSSSAFNDEERLSIDKAVDSAVENGIITTFIHYGYEKNIYPSGLLKSGDDKREPDIRILHYDYNTLFSNQYEKYISMNKADIKSGNDIPYYSISSTSPVLAGFIAIMKSIDNSLILSDYKKILKETSYSTYFTGYGSWENNIETNNVADIGKASEFVFKNKSKRK